MKTYTAPEVLDIIDEVVRPILSDKDYDRVVKKAYALLLEASIVSIIEMDKQLMADAKAMCSEEVL